MTDIEISNQCKKRKISDVISDLGICEEAVSYYGSYKAKIDDKLVSSKKNGKLILVTAINPTPYGEGKTTVSIGLGDAFPLISKKSIIVLREPSLGPVFGLKGGATGGGHSQVVPMDEINLHFTGDFHAITSANNLLCAAIDNHIKQGNFLQIDPDHIKFFRTQDVNDRALRNVRVALGGSVNGVERMDHFNITAASEVMTIFCLAKDLNDLKMRLGNILVGYSYEKKPIFARDLKVEGAMTVLLKDALKPNIVQTLEGNPVLIHGGPFANIAHGCNSIIATKLGLKLSDYVITEAGFGADLGAEKFLDITCRKAEIKPDVVVLVATIKALKYHAGISNDILLPNVDAVAKGLANLEAHVENLKKFGVSLVLCLNQYDTDQDEEIEVVRDYAKRNDLPFAVSTAYMDGGSGAVSLAQEVVKVCEKENQFHYLYDETLPIMEKIQIIATEIYRSNDVVYTDQAKQEIEHIEKLGMGSLPICIAKTQYSISDDPKKLGKPEGYTITVKDVRLYSGASFITVLLGDIMTMPGLPKCPNYEQIDLDEQGNIIGIF